MRKPLLSVLLSGPFLLTLLACSDGSPTQPMPASAQEAVSPEAMTRTRLARHVAPRSLAPRASVPSRIEGSWGGDQIGLRIDSNAATVEFGCAAGSIDEPFVTDASGRFSLPGSWWFTPPVVSQGWQPEKRPARYSGVVEGERMTLTVTLLDDNQLLGSFTLALNQTPRIVHCY